MSNQKLTQLVLKAFVYLSLLRSKPVVDVTVHAEALIQLPESEQLAGGPKQIGLVVDASGSMDGWKMEMVQACANKLVDTLNAEDSLAIVSFSSNADNSTKTILPITLMNEDGKNKARGQIARLVASGETYPVRGLRKIQELFKDREGKITFVLLGDGQSSDALDVDDNTPTFAEARQIRSKGITLFTGGIDLDDYTEAFLTKIAGAEANFRRINSAEDLTKLLSTVQAMADKSVITNARLVVRPLSNAQARSSLHKLQVVFRGGKGNYIAGDIDSRTLHIGDILSGDEIDVYLSLAVRLEGISEEERSLAKVEIVGDVLALNLKDQVLATTYVVQEFSANRTPVKDEHVKLLMDTAEVQEVEARFSQGKASAADLSQAQVNFAAATQKFDPSAWTTTFAAHGATQKFDPSTFIADLHAEVGDLASQASVDAEAARKEARTVTTKFDPSQFAV